MGHSSTITHAHDPHDILTVQKHAPLPGGVFGKAIKRKAAELGQRFISRGFSATHIFYDGELLNTSEPPPDAPDASSPWPVLPEPSSPWAFSGSGNLPDSATVHEAAMSYHAAVSFVSLHGALVESGSAKQCDPASFRVGFFHGRLTVQENGLSIVTFYIPGSMPVKSLARYQRKALRDMAEEIARQRLG